MILVDNKLGLFLNIKTYKKSLSKLFNYRTKDLKEINTIIENGTYLTRKDEKIIRVDKQSDIEPGRGEELLFYIRKMKTEIFLLENPIPINDFSFINYNINILNNKIWYVLNSNNPKMNNQNEDYFLCKYDIIKMGNIKLMVNDIHIEENKEIKQNIEDKIINYDINSLNKDNNPIFNILPDPKKYILSTEEAKNENKNCKICHKNECNIDNPIIGFCDCKNLFHFKCLKNIIQKKVSIKQNKKKTTYNYYIRELYCKDCKLNYPLKFKIKEKEKIFEIISIDIPKESNYMVLESIENEIYYGHIKLVFIIKLDEKEIIRIGRKRVNDIIVSDPSISKEHAEIKFEKGKILIKNKSETFGSLVLVKKPLKINENKICIQIGRTVISTRQMRFGEFETLKLKNKINHLTKKD